MFAPLASAVAASCPTQTDNITDRFSKLLCRMPSDAAGWQQLVSRAWPVAVAALALTVLAYLSWRIAARRAWNTLAAGAVWLEIIPPVSATPASTVELWRLLAKQIPASTSRLARQPLRLVWEVIADPDRVRVGVWVPKGVGVLNVSRRIQQAWPGARITQTTPPSLPDGLVLHGLRLTPSEPDTLDYAADLAVGRGSDRLDPMRSVYDSLAGAGRQGGAMLQVIVQKAPGWRLKAFTQMIADPGKARSAGASRVLDLMVRGVLGLVREIVSIFTTPSRPHTTTTTGDRTRRLTDEQQEQVDRAKTKKKRTPHFVAGIRIFALGEDRKAARNSAVDIAGGFDLIAPTLATRTLRQSHDVAVSRWVRQPQMVLSSVTELAAICTLPAEPPAYGIAGAASRRRAGLADLWRPAEPTPSTSDGHHEDDDGGDGQSFRFDPWRMS